MSIDYFFRRPLPFLRICLTSLKKSPLKQSKVLQPMCCRNGSEIKSNSIPLDYFPHTARASSSAMSKCPTSCCVPCVSPCACRSFHSGASSKSPLVHVLHERSDFIRMIHCNIICSRSVMIRCPFITVRFSRDHHFAVRNFFVQTTSATEHNKLVRLDNRMCIFNRAHTCRRAHIRFVESKFFSFVFKLIDRRLARCKPK